LTNDSIDYFHAENSVYPNPAFDKISISNSSKSDIVFVVDILGKQYQLPQQHQQQTRMINVSMLSTGVYVLKIFNTNNTQTKTIRFLKH